MEQRPINPAADPLIPIVVTAGEESATRRWQVRLASNGMRVHRPGHVFAPRELPAIAVRIDVRDVWMTWALPHPSDPAHTEIARRLYEASNGWALRPNAPERTPQRAAVWDSWLLEAREAGFHLPGYPGDVRWLTFTEPVVDWRTVADTAAMVITEESRKRFGAESESAAG